MCNKGPNEKASAQLVLKSFINLLLNFELYK